MIILDRRHRFVLGRVLRKQGADVRRLEFLNWLVKHQRHPEWYGVRRPLARTISLQDRNRA